MKIVVNGEAVEIGGGISNEKSWSNPNLLDNWYFPAPINQRGQTVYTAEGYTIDRWKMLIDIGVVSLEADGLVLDASNHAITFNQPMDPDVIRSLRGQTVTTSVLYTVLEQPAADAPLAVGYTVPDWQEYVSLRGASGRKTLSSGTLLVPETALELIWMHIPVGCKIKLHSIKMEHGKVQTLASKNKNGDFELIDLMPNYELELLKCQRYQFNSRIKNGSYYPLIGYASVVGSDIWAGVVTPVTMQKIPSMYGTGNIVVRHGTKTELIPINEWTVSEIGTTYLTLHSATSIMNDGDMCDIYLDGIETQLLFDSNI